MSPGICSLLSYFFLFCFLFFFNIIIIIIIRNLPSRSVHANASNPIVLARALLPTRPENRVCRQRPNSSDGEAAPVHWFSSRSACATCRFPTGCDVRSPAVQDEMRHCERLHEPCLSTAEKKSFTARDTVHEAHASIPTRYRACQPASDFGLPLITRSFHHVWNPRSTHFSSSFIDTLIFPLVELRSSATSALRLFV